ncbi:MAG TPA: helix-turn-helix transcriptional regulator [Chloroflexota bacterium]
MSLEQYIAEREIREPAFRAAREALRPQYEFRRALIAARLAAGLTQVGLANKLGTTQSAIARLESGTNMPTVETLCRLADVLGIQFEITPQVGLVAHAPIPR